MGTTEAHDILEPGEELVWQRPGNMAWRRGAISGYLVLTDRRVVFEPHRVEVLKGLKRWSAPLARIAAVGTQPRGYNPFTGSLRPRLRLAMEDGSAEIFLVNDLASAIGDIASAVERRRAVGD